MRAFQGLQPGEMIGSRYRIEALLGKGRSSAVYKATDQQSRVQVALKILDPFLAQDATAMERFRREAQIIRQINHPNVIGVHSLGQEDEFQVIVMEYFEGTDLKAFINRGTPAGLAEFLGIARSVASAIQACHEKQVLHRDIKPQNILWSPERSEVKLVDFGISRINAMSDLTKTGTILGTPEYLAPELFRNSRPDTRSDIYSLGVLFYELLAGRPPYLGVSIGSIMTQVMRGEFEDLNVARPEMPNWVCAIIRKCLSTDPGRRFQSCYELLTDFERGERAISGLEEKRAARFCIACKASLVAGLLFCHGCGKFADDVIEPGANAIILAKFEDQASMVEYFRRTYPNIPLKHVKKRLARLPCLLLRGISEKSAMAITNELAVYACEFHVSSQLPTELKLPWYYLPLGLLPLVVSLAFLNLGDFQAYLGGAAAGLVLLVSLYLRKIIPLVSHGKKKAPVPEGLLKQMIANSRLLAMRKDMNLKTIAGSFLAKYYRICSLNDLSDSQGELRVTVENALAVLEKIESYQVYLEGSSLNGIREKQMAVEARLAQAGSNSEAEALIERKSRLQAEFQEYQDIQEQFATAYLGILNLNSTLQKMEDRAA